MCEDKEYIIKTVNEIIKLASEKYDKKFPEIEIKFDLTGNTAGMFCRKFKTNVKKLRFNFDIFIANRNNFKHIIIHEVAHYIVSENYVKTSKIKTHGREWKYTVINLGGFPQTTHNLIIPISEKKMRQKIEYSCKCKTHYVSKLIHKKITLGKSYKCNICKSTIYLKEKK